MYLNLFILKLRIEQLRKHLHNVISNNASLTNSNVIECSQKLDQLLVTYEKAKLYKEVA